MSDTKALEHSTLMVPYEFLNRHFRNAQKVIDREVSHVNSTNEKIKKLAAKNNTTVKESSDELECVLEKLHVLKRKASDALLQEDERLAKCQHRIAYLKDEATTKQKVLVKHNRLERMLIDHFLRSGYYETAIYMTENSTLREYIDLDLFLVARDVEKSLQEKNLVPCLQWCHQNKSKLKKIQSTLELNLRIQEFVELVKKDLRIEAILYARKHFKNDCLDSETGPMVQKSLMALLAFSKDTQVKPYKEKFNENRWDFLIGHFRRENFRLYQLNSQSVLEIVLQCGLSSMKTPHCYHEEENDQDCPVCNDLFNELAKPLPFAHSSQSRLLCSVTRERMNDNNPPLMLPNGNVYSESALQQMCSSSSTSITCPKTQDKYTIQDVRKIFIM